MLKIDMWYSDDVSKADKIDVAFYPNDGKYRGNIYRNGKCIGDYVCDDSVELEKHFRSYILVGIEGDKFMLFKKNMTVSTVKEKMKRFPWWELTREKHFDSTREVNLYYRDGGNQLVIWFDGNRKYAAYEIFDGSYNTLAAEH